MEAAERLHYNVHPVYASLGRRLKDGKGPSGLNLAILFDEHHDQTRREAAEADIRPIAEAHSCHLSVISMGPDDSPARIEQIISSQGIAGVLIPRIPSLTTRLSELNLDSVAVICKVGRWHPLYQTIDNDYFGAVQFLCREFYRRGRRRIGFALPFTDPPAVDDYFRFGGYTTFFENQDSKLAPLPRWTPPKNRAFGGQLDSFRQWVETCNPDAVIGFSEVGHHFLRELGIPSPAQIAYAGLLISPSGTVGGMYASPDIDEIAIETLISDSLQGKFGKVRASRNIRLSMRYLDHKSLD